jgi:hypothetical protein
MFCYPSDDRVIGFEATTQGCNRAAVYNYRRDCWTFYDLPNVTSATNSVVASGQTWTSVGSSTWSNIGGTYTGEASVNDRHHLFASCKNASAGVSSSRIVGMDLVSRGRLARPVVAELLKDAFVERVGIDLDEGGIQLSAYKSLLKVYPQIAVSDQTGSVLLQYGANDVSAVSPEWDMEQPFDNEIDYQRPVRKAGRYLAHRLRHTGYSDFSYSGFDATVTVRGKR